MKKMKKFDRRVWIFIIVVSLLIPLFFQVRARVFDFDLPLSFVIVGIPFTFVVTATITYVNMVLLGRYFDRILPWVNDSRKITRRLLLEIPVTTLSAALLISVIALILDIVFPQMAEGRMGQVYFDNITVAIIVNLIALSIIEGNSIYTMLKDSLFEKEKLQREKVESQFAVLKNQVNPHFLFNSLNVLSSLIAQSPAVAKDFVQDFARIYRYIFDVGDETVVAVKRELEFIESYISLQKKRHGDNLRLDTRISGELLDMFIPVLSLQMLVENAIKHNEISADKPLHIDIYSEGQQLVVKNDYQLRDDSPASLGIGLQNLKDRYGYLSNQQPSFYTQNGHYYARLPLLTEE
jgi:hypothetical protein